MSVKFHTLRMIEAAAVFPGGGCCDSVQHKEVFGECEDAAFIINFRAHPSQLLVHWPFPSADLYMDQEDLVLLAMRQSLKTERPIKEKGFWLGLWSSERKQTPNVKCLPLELGPKLLLRFYCCHSSDSLFHRLH